MSRTYSNPRLEATVTDWPMGKLRGTAVFTVESHPQRGQRATRFTIDPKSGLPSATKKLTYATRVRIVDGDDGRLYIARMTAYHGFVTIMRGTMDVEEETIYRKDERYPEIMELFREIMRS